MLAEALSELEAKVESISGELETIRRYVERMEADNASMQEIIRKKNMAGTGKANLYALFEAGFHICSAHFGETREGDCLFCATLMDKGKLSNEDSFKSEKSEKSDSDTSDKLELTD